MLLTAGATLYAPKTRTPIYEPHGMTWPEFREVVDEATPYRERYILKK